MRKASARTYTWLYRDSTDDAGDTWLEVAFVRGLSADEALARLTPEKELYATPAEGGTVVFFGGLSKHPRDLTPLLSAGTAAALVEVTVDDDRFAYYEDGRLITAFNLFTYDTREGLDPDRFRAEVEDLRLHVTGDSVDFPADHAARALALADRATGVRLPRDRNA
ncbi:hypothetical protein GT755_23950 [Herbidospora sp. NEAU-GS84]|uniref:DUF4265 domain-containing protein n=1 Tax=Herbidospora solisilvae TaxID=2696284 RepID=A0A7C9JAE1_9ACTN|nr:DUF6461 domain-containing protein [Herbidospora solisilvae]NAS24728.1 hypothetical protein [Herbidospora solisilvae]